jgi:hypothetical protein
MTTPPEHPLLDVAFGLRSEEFRTSPGFIGPNPKLRQVIHADLQAAASGEICAFRPEARLRGLALRWAHDNPYMGRRQERVVLSYRPGDAEAEAWALAFIEARLDDFDDELLMTLFPHQAAVREQMLAHPDFGVDSLIVVGAVDDALRTLKAEVDPQTMQREGLVSMTFGSPHVPATVTLREAVFRAQPEACWFGADEAHLPGLQAALETAAAQEDPMHRAWMRHTALVAALGCEEADHALWGRSAGLDIVLAPALHGRGLVKLAYLELLQRCHDRGIPTFYGSSSQPGVLGLGLRMGRQVCGLSMRRARLRPSDWFRPWLEAYAR